MSTNRLYRRDAITNCGEQSHPELGGSVRGKPGDGKKNGINAKNAVFFFGANEKSEGEGKGKGKEKGEREIGSEALAERKTWPRLHDKSARKRENTSLRLGQVKKLVVYHPRFSTKFGRADGFLFYFLYIYSVCGLCEQSRGPLRNGRCCSVLYVAASVTGSTGSAAYTWPTLTKIKTQQEYIRISCTLANQESG